jgi:transcriptional regulator with XRE-family HTH domain
MSEKAKSVFAGRLKELREKAGITQQELAEKAGVHKLTVAKLEQGIREPTWETALALADSLGVSCEVLRQRSGATPETRMGRPPKAEAPKPAKPRQKKPKK